MIANDTFHEDTLNTFDFQNQRVVEDSRELSQNFFHHQTETQSLQYHDVCLETRELKPALQQNQIEDQNENLANIINKRDFESMLIALQQDQKCMDIRDWSKLNWIQFASLFLTKETLTKNFQKHELSICCKSVQHILHLNGEDWNVKWPKYKMIDALSKLEKADMEI
jgi:hypothetical protein